MRKLKVYFDMCSLNRPYDDQAQTRIQQESTSKLLVQSLIVDGHIDFVWSYMLEYENSKNPFTEKRNAILDFKNFAVEIIKYDRQIVVIASGLQNTGINIYDSLHVACAIFSKCNYFITVDDKLLNKQSKDINFINPTVFIDLWLNERSKL